MSKPILDNLFGSKARVKVLKFLYRNHPQSFSLGEIARRTQETPTIMKQELALLKSIHVIRISKKRI
jgi:predicted transcriptional regulator with HTH domain